MPKEPSLELHNGEAPPTLENALREKAILQSVEALASIKSKNLKSACAYLLTNLADKEWDSSVAHSYNIEIPVI